MAEKLLERPVQLLILLKMAAKYRTMFDPCAELVGFIVTR